MGLLAYLGFKSPAPQDEDKKALALEQTIGLLPYLMEYVMLGHPLPARAEWVFTGPQTDKNMLSPPVSPLTRNHITMITVALSPSAPNNVPVRIGFADATLPVKTDAPPGAPRMLVSHTLTPGSAIVQGNGSAVLTMGASAGQDLRITCGDPGGAELTVIASYYTTDFA